MMKVPLSLREINCSRPLCSYREEVDGRVAELRFSREPAGSRREEVRLMTIECNEARPALSHVVQWSVTGEWRSMTACVWFRTFENQQLKKDSLRAYPPHFVHPYNPREKNVQLASNEHKEQASYRLAKPFFRLPRGSTAFESGPGNPGLTAIPHYLPTAIAAQ